MMNKIIFFLVCLMSAPTYAINLDPNFLTNSPFGYLLDLDIFCNDSQATRQIGNVLFERNYTGVMIASDSQTGCFDVRPADKINPAPFARGQWIWIPSSFNSSTGTWYWVEKKTPYYIAYLASLME